MKRIRSREVRQNLRSSDKKFHLYFGFDTVERVILVNFRFWESKFSTFANWNLSWSRARPRFPPTLVVCCEVFTFIYPCGCSCSIDSKFKNACWRLEEAEAEAKQTATGGAKKHYLAGNCIQKKRCHKGKEPDDGLLAHSMTLFFI